MTGAHSVAVGGAEPAVPAPAVSVILSTHNRAAYLPDVLQSLAAQACRVPFEVILIDNASTDRTREILTEWCGRHAGWRVAHEARLGLSCGKNAGVGLARAPLLLFADDDMLLSPGWIQSYLDLFGRRDEGRMLAGGPYVPIPHDLGGWPDWFEEGAMADLALLQYDRERVLEPSEYVWGGNMAIPRRFFDELGPWDESVGRRGEERGTFEDTEFQDRLRRAGGHVWYCPAAVVRHRMPRDVITPREIASSAFTRGRNDFWKETIPVWHEQARVPRRNPVAVLVRLALSLLAWAVWLLAFRVTGGRRAFERVRDAAFRSGRHLDSLRAGRGPTPLTRLVNRAAFKARGLLLRLSPDTA